MPIIYSKEQAENCFDDCLDYIERLEIQNRDLQFRNEILLKEAREIANRELLEENMRLKNKLKLSFGQFSSQRELDDFNEFCEEHLHDRTTSKENGGKNPYVIQEGTGIGLITKVKCPICGEEKDITDIEVW